MKFIEKYNQYKMIYEGTIKSLIPIIQQDMLDSIYDGKKFNELKDEEKQYLQKAIDEECKYVQSLIESWTSNKQYQSWLYTILSQGSKNISDKFSQIEYCIKYFEKICKKPDLTPEQKNIQNYKTFQDLQQFILEYQNAHKQNNNIYNCFKKLYSNNSFTIYLINKDQYQDCNRLFGGNEFWNTGWCVAKNEMLFDKYLSNQDYYNGYIVWITNKDNKPFALLHYGSGQFKDTSDDVMTDTHPDVIDGLNKLNDTLSWYDIVPDKNTYKDLTYYLYYLWKHQNPNKLLGEYIAYEKNLIFNKENKTIDCKGLTFIFNNSWFKETGTFDFKLINTSNNWDYMFYECSNLTHLPETFEIPSHVISCNSMFEDCKNIKNLPENFIIPEKVTSTKRMFYNCNSLISLPDNFTIPNNVKDSSRMFYRCESLTHLPDKFKLGDNNQNCEMMFRSCHSLLTLPKEFYIPKSITNSETMFQFTPLRDLNFYKK